MDGKQLYQRIDQRVKDHLEAVMTSALAKLKAAMDEGPGGTVTLTTEEACVAYRLITKS